MDQELDIDDIVLVPIPVLNNESEVVIDSLEAWHQTFCEDEQSSDNFDPD